MRTVIPIVIAVTIFCGSPSANDLGGEIRLRPYAEWVKTSPAKSLLQYVRETASALVNQETAAPPEEGRFPWRQQPVGVFVTAMKGRKVRSCVGALIPEESTLGEEIYRQCKRLAAGDIRHPPLAPGELDSLRFVISFTGNSVSVSDPLDLDIWREGLLMRWNGREAVLLPGEAKTLSWGINELRRQVQIPETETPSYAVFPVVILQEPPPTKKP